MNTVKNYTTIHWQLNVKLMEENVIQIKSGITINVDVSVKSIIYLQKIIFGILLHVAAKNVKYLAGIIDGSVITCDEIIEAKNKNYSNKF